MGDGKLAGKKNHLKKRLFSNDLLVFQLKPDFVFETSETVFNFFAVFFKC